MPYRSAIDRREPSLVAFEIATRHSLLVATVLSLVYTAVAQDCIVPRTIWEKTLGGTSDDIFSSLEVTLDGGYIIGGRSLSQSNGTKSSPNWGDRDFWVVRLDAEGNQLWDRSFGGNAYDELVSLQQTSDGGFVFAGDSSSSISGNKTTPRFGTSDYWVVRTDESGNMLWDRPFGGEYSEFLRSIGETSDGGFILAGISEYIGGNKTSPWYGHWDGWIVRIDKEGAKLWDKSFGGAGDDRISVVFQTTDGGFLLGGLSESTSGGNKTAPAYGTWDYWVIRLDSQGNKVWERTFGGSHEDTLRTLYETPDQAIIVGGTSFSPPSGNKTTEYFGQGDYWILLLDSTGHMLWERSFGGAATDVLTSIRQTRDGGFVMAGSSSSEPSGNKTSPHFGDSYQADVWVVRIDRFGNKLWESVYGGTGHESQPVIRPTADSGFILAAASNSFPGEHTGDYDYWLVKLGPEPPPDADCDGVPDSEDQCPESPAGSVVTSFGCTVNQLAPCDGPWRSHGDYLRAARAAASIFLREGLFSRKAQREYLIKAAQSDCGKSRPHLRSMRGARRRAGL